MEKIAILDCGGQYTKVIDRKVRELEVNTMIFPINIPADKLEGFSAIILSGGPDSVWQEGAIKTDDEIFKLGVPIFGICYGMQLMNIAFGGTVSPHIKKEYGEATIDIDVKCPLFSGMDSKQDVLMSHGDSVDKLADGFLSCAKSEDLIVGIYNEEKKCYGVQFHPEVDLSINGIEMIDKFLRDIAGLKERFCLEDRLKTSIDDIKNRVGDRKVVVLVSGGVDSAVTAALLTRAVSPQNIIAIHVDHGLMRKNESDLICEQLKEQGLVNLHRLNTKDEFFYSKIENNGKILGPLSKLTDPEEKRQCIGEMFIKVVQDKMDELNIEFDDILLAQGTLRPDLIESGNPDVSSHAKKIKTHHNDVDAIRKARDVGMVVETNRDWHKDEVRKVGNMLGLSKEVTERQPFPGPGLGVRILCSDGNIKVSDEVNENFDKVISEIGNEKIKAKVLPVKTVGVQGDCRTYGLLGMISCEQKDFNWNDIYSISKTVTNKVSEVNRIVYLLSDNYGDISAVKHHDMYINDETTRILREIDNIVTANVIHSKISQTFAVLLPIGVTKKYSVVIRTFVTSDFMTGRPAFVGDELHCDKMFELAKRIKGEFDDIEFVFYDVTSKPPATCEWE